MEARNGKLLLQDRPTDIDEDGDDDDDDDNNNDDNEETDDDDDDDDKEEEKEEEEQKEDCGYDDKREDDDNEKKKAKKKEKKRKKGGGGGVRNKKSLRNDEEGNSIDKNNTRHTFFSFDTFRRGPLSAKTWNVLMSRFMEDEGKPPYLYWMRIMQMLAKIQQNLWHPRGDVVWKGLDTTC